MVIARARRGIRHLFVRDLVLACRIGVHPHEHAQPQRVRVNLDLGVIDQGAPEGDVLAAVVDYQLLVERVRATALAGHVNLVETLAERLAALCLEDPRVRSARVRVEKLDALADVAAVGVEIERLSTQPRE
jgi:dihydroneopterin aldolase